MQNKANFPDIQMNVSYVKIKNYEQGTMDNEPIKQSQANPISPTSAGFAIKTMPKRILKSRRSRSTFLPFDFLFLIFFLVFVDGLDDLLGVAEVDDLDFAGERPLFLVEAVELGQFFLVAGLEVSVPVVEFSAPYNLGVVLREKNYVRKFVALPSVEIADVDTVEFKKQGPSGTGNAVHAVELLQ